MFHSVEPVRLALAFLSALLAAAVNSVAGGGTLISFPVLVALGLPSVTANATSTLGIWPGTLGSLWGFRRELAQSDRRLRWLVLPCVVGGAVGALLLRLTSSATFDRVVPFLVLFATVLFAARGAVQAWLRRRAEGEGEGEREGEPRGPNLALGIALTLGVGVYGGYFGAAMSIMNLSVLGVLGMTSLLEMNALTSLFSLCVNGVAVVIFVAAGLVSWPFVVAMAAGALVGGYGAAGVARRVGRVVLARFIVAVGLTVSVVFLVRSFA